MEEKLQTAQNALRKFFMQPDEARSETGGRGFSKVVVVFQDILTVDGSEIRRSPVDMVNTLPETNIAMENPPFGWYLPGKMGIFMGYVSFREGIPLFTGF